MAIELSAPALAPVAALLQKKLTAGLLPQAILFEGASAALRKEAALALGRALLCAGPEQDADEEMFAGTSLFGAAEETLPAGSALPCERCAHCRKSAAGAHPDLQLLEGGAGARSFHIDAIRALRQDSAVLPNEAEVKVYLLHNAQSMTAEAQNALLKLLEEPPDYVCLILTAPQRRLLLQTVLSRVTTLTLGETDEEAADSEREALVQRHAQAIAGALAQPDGRQKPYAALEATAALEGDKELACEVLPALRRALHARLLQKPALASQLLPLLDGVQELTEALGRNANLNLVTTQLAALSMNNEQFNGLAKGTLWQS